jgi:hypothetical protein
VYISFAVSQWVLSWVYCKSHLNHKGHKELQEKHPRLSVFIRG